MSTQPKALFLADVIDNDPRSKAHHDATAAELRRLHAFCEDYAQHKERQDQRVLKLHAQRDALLEALRTLFSYANTLEMRLLDADGEHRAMQQARAAIAAVGEKK